MQSNRNPYRMNRQPWNTALIALALGFALAACGEPVQNAPKAGDDITVEGFTWRVRSAETITAEYAGAGKDAGPGLAVDAYVGTLNGSPIVTTQPPRVVDDAVACSLGHEVMHLAIGDYHRMREAK